MKHDPLCPYGPGLWRDGCETCDLIVSVRANERVRVLTDTAHDASKLPDYVQFSVQDVQISMTAARDDGYKQGYRDGYNARAASASMSYQMYGIPEYNSHGTGANP